MSNFNIDPSKLTGDWLKWAQEAEDAEANPSKDNVLLNSAFEKEYVKAKALSAGKTEDDIAAYFNSIKAEEPQDAAGIMGANFSRTKKDIKTIKKDVVQVINSVSSSYLASEENINWKNLSDDVKKYLDSKPSTDREYDNQLMSQVDKVADALKDFKYGSRDDIKEMYDTAKSKLDKKDEFYDFQLDVLKQFVMIAENNQKQVETNKLKDKYFELKETMGREAAIEELQKNPEFKGSYYHDYFGVDREEKFNHKPAHLHKGLIHSVEKNTVKVDALKDIRKSRANVKVNNPESTTSRQVKKDIIEDLGDKYDKYAKKALRGDMPLKAKMEWEKSGEKAKDRAVAIDHKVAINTAKAYDSDDVYKHLKHNEVFRGLVRAEKITMTKDGYNITELANEIRKKVGAELVANTQHKDYYEYSEIERIVKRITATSGKEASKTDAKRLIHMCGFPTDGKKWVKIVTNAAIRTAENAFGLIGTAAAIGVEAFAQYAGNRGPYNVSIDYNKDVPFKVIVNQTDHIEVLLNSDFASSLSKKEVMNLIAQGFNVQVENLTTGGFKLILDRASTATKEAMFKVTDVISKDVLPEDLGIDFDDIDAKAEKTNTVPAILTGLAMNFAINLLSEAMKQQVEKPVLVTQFDTDDIDQYIKEYIDSNKTLSQELKDGLKTIAYSYCKKDDEGLLIKDESGKAQWDSEKFKKFLNLMAGDGSMLNRHETAVGIDEKLNELDAEESDPPKPPVQETPEAAPPTTPAPVRNDYKATNVDPRLPNANKYYPDELALMYADFPKDAGGKPTKTAVRMIKVMQGMGITNEKGEYDEKTFQSSLTIEQIQTLAEVSQQKCHLHYKTVNGKRVPDKANYEQQVREAFKDVEFLKDYNFNYAQFVNAIAEPVPGDNANWLIAPPVLFHDDGATCGRIDPRGKGRRSSDKGSSNVGNRGTSGGTGEFAVQEGSNKARRVNSSTYGSSKGTETDWDKLNW